LLFGLFVKRQFQILLQTDRVIALEPKLVFPGKKVVGVAGHMLPSWTPDVIALEVKQSDHWRREWSKHMLNLVGTKKVRVNRMFGIYCGERTYRFGDILVYPVKDFIEEPRSMRSTAVRNSV
jgi:hypothetical protein